MVLSVSEGSTTKFSCMASSYSPSCAVGCHMLIGVIVTNLCRFPFGSMTVLGAVDGVATFGAWLTRVFSSVICVSIVCLSTSYAIVIVVIGADIVS